jgi:molecular chaperone Hsp33
MYKNIAQDLAWYYLQSEQIHTAFNTSIQFDKQGRIIGAGGMFVQTMPGAEEETIERVEAAFSAAPSYGQWFAEKGNRNDIIYGLFREFRPNVVLERNILFDCQCSEEKFKEHLLHLSKEELIDICTEKQNEPIELICHYCGSIYKYDKQKLLNSIK